MKEGQGRIDVINIKRIVFFDFVHRLVSQEQTKLKIIDKR
jgi:hypothetical protein